jgi:dolichol kinase
MNEFPNVERHYSGEVARKAIHICSLSIPIVYSFVPQTTLLTVLVPLTVVFGVSDLARIVSPPIRTLYLRLFGWLLRAHEKDERGRRLNGATYVLLSATLGVVIFPKVIFITAFSILIISDTVAALVGRKFGRRPFMKKSLEGAAGFFLSAVCVVLLAPKVGYIPAEYLIGVAAALVGTVVEAISGEVDDNLTIPFSIGGVMWVMYGIFVPALNLSAFDVAS